MAVTTQELIYDIYRKSNGELDDSVTVDSEDGQTILSIVNEQIEQYHNLVDDYGDRVVFASNVDPSYDIGDSNGIDTDFEIDYTEVGALLDGYDMPIMHISPDGTRTRYDIVPINELFGDTLTNDKACSITANGLTFRTAPPDGSIVAPVYLKGRKLNGSENDVEAVSQVHNILWLMQASAAEYNRTDFVRGEQYPNMLAIANATLDRMISNERMRTQPKTWHWDNSGSSCGGGRWYDGAW